VTRILVLRPSAACPPAALGTWLVDAGARLDVVAPQELPGAADGYQAVVCLGGEMGANDDAEHPWLAGMRALLAGAVRAGTPVLGICLGAQLLAAATGGAVRRAPGGPECGTPPITLAAAVAGDALLGGMGRTAPAVQSHSDEVHVLPPGAVRLAFSKRCANQVFRLGDRAWGLQCHVETTPELVLEWVRRRRDAAKVDAWPPAELDPEHLRAHHVEIEQAWRPVAKRFVRLSERVAASGSGR
jgi:GMP synthase-like glutamine amidotransferase